MSRLGSLAKKIFGRGEKAGPRESPEALRALFKSRYSAFKGLLDANNSTLEVMSSLERALHGNQSFGMGLIRASCTAISVNVYKIIQNMNELSSDRHAALHDVFEEIRERVTKILGAQRQIGGGEWILPLEDVNRDMTDQVGGKMANIGEVRNRVGLPVAEGFVITASAYQVFLEHNKLQEEINRRIQVLDIENLETLYKASADIQQLIVRSQLPPQLEEAILSFYGRLEEKAGKGVKVSMRSSALGEDTEETSFAGQYRSELNVSREFLSHAYKEILASKYTSQAMAYRLTMGFRDEDIAMSVGCMAMVDAASGGVMYSRDPGNIRNNVVLINAVLGLGKPVVDGSVSPDLFVVSKEPPGEILKKEIRSKDQKLVCFPEEGVCTMALTGEDQERPSITDDQARALAGLASRLEDHFGSPQDVEWAIDQNGALRVLQSRPLRQMDTETEAVRHGHDSPVGEQIVLEGGVTACPGVASGPAFLVDSTVDALQFPTGAVLIVQHSLPKWAALLSRAVAVITDRGGITGHLATVSREFNVPALFNTAEAMTKIENGTILTVDADGRKVYAGRVESLLEEAAAEKTSLMKGSPVYRVLEEVLEHISPLNLTDPDANNFRPQACQTYHDITRFCHEEAVREMFSYGKNHDLPEHASKQLVCDIPMKWWIIDLEDGFKGPVEGDTVKLADIASVPMLALWHGITAVPWKGPPPVNVKGFLSVMFRSTMDPSLDPTRQSLYAVKNYFMISKNFCNLSSRWGYHFSTIETLVGENPKHNYASFFFKGGGADFDRRVLRLRFIERILKEFDFRVEINEDSMMARVEGYEKGFIIERLKVLGYVSIHTRQLDMIMADQATVNHYINEHLEDIRSFVSG